MPPTKNRKTADRPKYRVLVVEHEVGTREDHVKNLGMWHYEAVIAEGTGAALLESAERQARDRRCHVALVDMILFHEDLANQISLDLLSKLKPTESIVVTGYDTVSATRKVMLEKGAYALVGKKEGPLALRAAIEGAIVKFWPSFPKVKWPVDYKPEQIIERMALDAGDDVRWLNMPPDELDHVLRRLFQNQTDASTIELKSLTATWKVSPGTLSPRRSVVLYAQPQGDQRRDILKLAPQDVIQREIRNYKKHVRRHLDADLSAQIVGDPVSLWDIGGILYTDQAKKNRKSFTDWYRLSSTSSEMVSLALQDLFKGTLGPWYSPSLTKVKERNLYRYYAQAISHLGQRIKSYKNQMPIITLDGIGDLPNPVLWASKCASRCEFEAVWDAIRHGDLHADNVFVDSDFVKGKKDQTYIIDYERTGPGHRLRDFVELESDIRLRLLQFPKELPPAQQLQLAKCLDSKLLAPSTPQEAGSQETGVWVPPTGVDQAVARDLEKAFEAISALRRLAWELTKFDRMDEYYWALLMETLFSVTRDTTNKRALLSAAFICDRLSPDSTLWPPTNWAKP